VTDVRRDRPYDESYRTDDQPFDGDTHLTDETTTSGCLDCDGQATTNTAETVAYVAGRRLGIDTERSSRYLAAWDGDAAETVRERLGRIQRTTERVLTAVPAVTDPRADDA